MHNHHPSAVFVEQVGSCLQPNNEAYGYRCVLEDVECLGVEPAALLLLLLVEQEHKSGLNSRI
jgi:hypothetical protein